MDGPGKVEKARAWRMPAPLAALLVAAGLMGLAWLLMVPALQTPDEVAHFAYTQRIVETHSLPQTVKAKGFPFSSEVGTAANYADELALVGNLGARPATNPAIVKVWRRANADLFPGARKNGTGANPARQNPPLYYLYEAIPYEIASHNNFFDRLYLMRLASIPLYLATIAFAWLIAGELFHRRTWMQTIAAGVVAVQPQFAFIGSAVNPDVLLAAVWAAFLWVAIRTVKYGPTVRRILAIGALSAASVLTHGRGIPILLPAGLAVGIALWRNRPFTPRLLAAAGGAAAIVVGVVAAYFAIVSGSGGSVDGGTITASGGKPFSLHQFASYVWQFYLPKLSFMDPMIGPHYTYKRAFVETFYGIFGNLEVEFPAWIHSAELWFSLLLVAGVIVAVVLRWRSVRSQWPVAIVLLAAIFGMLAGLHVAAYRGMLVNPVDPIIVGRYLFPLITLFGAAVAMVVSILPRRIGPLVGVTIVMLGLALELAGLGLTAARFYA
jgi:4-amino-4-deoxy-L-arabinose transferase-like glycosyltransferase